MEVISLTESTFDDNIKSGIVLVDFWAKWCMPCRIQSPIIEKVSTEMVGKASVFKLDIDKNPSIADRFNIQSIPTIIIFKDGKPIGQFVGITEKADIVSAIEKLSSNKLL
ncbi:MAG: thioredoxin [Bacteroidetes bacterium]|nr:thioredoxin [Bacteroidota bacterium]